MSGDRVRFVDCPQEGAECQLCAGAKINKLARWFYYPNAGRGGAGGYNALSVCSFHALREIVYCWYMGIPVEVRGKPLPVPEPFADAVNL